MVKLWYVMVLLHLAFFNPLRFKEINGCLFYVSADCMEVLRLSEII